MKLTKGLRDWATDNIDGVDAETDATGVKTAIATALVAGDLTPEKFTELSKSAEDDDANEFKSLLGELTKAVQGLKDGAAVAETEAEVEDDVEDDVEDVEASDDDAGNDTEDEEVAETGKSTQPGGTKGGNRQPSNFEKMLSSSARGAVGFGVSGEAGDFTIRVKEAAEQYSTTKSAMVYPTHNEKGKPHVFAGQQVMDGATGRPLDTPSELDKAVSGAFAKYLVGASMHKSRSQAFANLPQHDKELLAYAMENMTWGGATDGGDTADIKGRRLHPSEQKALIDDATSGGLEAAPIVFDDQVIQTPLLHGELYPLVNVKPLDRGRRVEGVATGTVTSSWGGVDDSAITLFNTASYVSAFDTTIFRWEGAVRVGLDFLSDTPIDFGAHITAQYGERLMEDLDDVIAAGNGTTQPEGVVNKSGATSVSFGGATSLGNYESLRFGVAKNEHRQNLVRTAVFIGTETSYQRARAIPVGSSDARRLGGMDYSSYRWMERDYKINESLTNQQIAYTILGRYRMYRRRGFTMRTSTEGDTLIRNNEMLLVAMARYGGQQERGATIALTSDAPA
jgi:HK97 family phage major capsid protein